MTTPRPLPSVLLVLAAAAAVVLGLVTPASAAAPYCGLTWGSATRGVGATSTENVSITGVRAGPHPCYDRLVVDLTRSAGFGGYTVGYGTVRGANDVPVALRGGADLSISVHAPAYDAGGHATYQPADRREAVPVSGYRTFRQVTYVESFEGYTLLGLGVRARLPFRAFVLPGSPGRMVVDVAHRW
jgi:hypothetical protein